MHLALAHDLGRVVPQLGVAPDQGGYRAAWPQQVTDSRLPQVQNLGSGTSQLFLLPLLCLSAGSRAIPPVNYSLTIEPEIAPSDR
jgi:hypothetical protein